MAVRSKQEILDILDRAGLHHMIAGREEELPEQLDTDHDQALLEHLGINRGDIMEALGSSP